LAVLGMTATVAGAQTDEVKEKPPCAQTNLVEFEKMTWVEVKCEIAAGKTTALIYTGGVEERGPQNANGRHDLIAHATGPSDREKTRQCYIPARAALHPE